MEKKVFLDKAIDVYKALSKIKILESARIFRKFNSNYYIHTRWVQKNIELEKPIKSSKVFKFNFEECKSFDSCGLDTYEDLVSICFDSNENQAFIKDILDKDNKKQFLFVTGKNSVERTVNLTALDLHGNVCTYSEFNSFDFSPDGNYLLYIAEKKKNTEPWYKRKSETKDISNDKTNLNRGNEYIYEQDWGEQTHIKHPIICIYDIKNDTVKVLDKFFDGEYPGQVVWTPDSKGLVGVAWCADIRKLGVYACTGRRNYLFYMELDENNKTITKLSDLSKTVRSPRFSSNNYLVWLEREHGGPHRTCMKLMGLNFPYNSSIEVDTLIDYVDESIPTSNNKKFYGIYTSKLPQRCFSNDGTEILFSTESKNKIKSYRFNLKSKKLNEIFPLNEESIKIQDVFDDLVVATSSDLKTPDSIFVYKLQHDLNIPEQIYENQQNWSTIHDILQDYSVEEIDFEQSDNSKIKKFSGIYFGPTNLNRSKSSVPLILISHGGPHGVYSNEFYSALAFFATFGFAILLVNYRGSTGFGQKTINFLINQIGRADVDDCLLALNKILEKYECLDKKRLIVYGGSHGGFLGAHLIGQKPELFACAILLNPVIDIASMYITTDIPDWCTVLFGEKYDQAKQVNDELMIKQRNSSPIVHAHKVKTPTLLALGKNDVRVPCSQGLDFYYRLKANGVKTKVLMYEDNHSLLDVKHDFDVKLNILSWIYDQIQL